MKKVIILFIILTCVFTTPVCAESSYAEQGENIGVEELEKSLDEKTQEFFRNNGIDVKQPDWVNKLTTENVFSHIWKFITDGAKTPIKVGILIASVIFLTASFTAFGTTPRFETAIYAAVLSISAIISADIWQCVKSSANAVRGCSSFMLSFIPIFASALALSGKTVTAPAMSALLLAATETVSYIASFVVLPLMGGYLALSICSSVSPLVNGMGIVESVKKLSMWIMSFFSTLFIGILGIQTAVNSAADSVTLRTAKFILGTSVPVAGSVLGEAVSTISESMSLLKSSVGIYGVAALIFMFLPIVVELVLWRCVLMLDISLGEVFSLPKITGILRAVDSMISLLLGLVLMIGGIFVISLAVVVTVGK